MRHVIIGSGPAGVIAAETLRKNAPGDHILLIGREAHPPYSRMDIPAVLKGDMPEAGTYLRRDAQHFSALRIDCKRAAVQRIDTRARTVLMDDGTQAPFDRLLIASGSSPVRPYIPGIGASAVHTCWTLDDARRISALAKPGAQVTLIGAGLIGCAVMEALAARGVRLTVIEKAERMVPAMFGAGAGRMIRRWCEHKGIRVHVSTRVASIEPTLTLHSPDGAALRMRLSGGEQIAADLVVCTAGARPNIGFLRGSGIKCANGILVDATMRTSIKGIYAAGDCAESIDHAVRSQSSASEQACCAAHNMLGRQTLQPGVRRTDALEVLGMSSASLGQWRGVPGGQWVELIDDRNFRYLRLEFGGEVLVGANHVGLADHATVLEDLIRHRVELGEWKDRLLQDPTRLKEAYRACVRLHYAGQAAASVIAHAARVTH